MQATKERTRSPSKRKDARRSLLLEELVQTASRVDIDKLELLCDAAAYWEQLSLRDVTAVEQVLRRHVDPDKVQALPAWRANVYAMSDYLRGSRAALMEGGAS